MKKDIMAMRMDGKVDSFFSKRKFISKVPSGVKKVFDDGELAKYIKGKNLYMEILHIRV